MSILYKESHRRQANHRRRDLIDKLQEVIADIDARPCEWNGREPFRSTRENATSYSMQSLCGPCTSRRHVQSPFSSTSFSQHPQYSEPNLRHTPQITNRKECFVDVPSYAPQTAERKGRFVGVDVAGNEVYSRDDSAYENYELFDPSESHCLYSDDRVQCRLLDQKIKECPQCCTTLLCSTIEKTTIIPPEPLQYDF